MAGHGGGAWKVAYADFVTAMMAFFMVMWITAQSKPVKQAVAKYFNDPFNTSATLSGSGGAAGGAAPLPYPFSGSGDSRGLKQLPLPGPGLSIVRPKAPKDDSRDAKGSKPSVFVLHDGKKEMRGTVVLFKEDSAALDDRAQDQAKYLAKLLVGKRNKIEIRGHTTRRPLPAGSPFTDSWQLSYARCQTIRDFLQAAGVEPDRMRMSQAAGYEPYSNHTEPQWQAKNSRVEIYSLDELCEDLIGTREERAERFKSPPLRPAKTPPAAPHAAKPAPAKH